MPDALRRYQFSERLADILGESRRDLRVRVTLLVSAGMIAPGPRGPGSPPASPAYAADLLIGVLAAPKQRDTVEAIRCYRQLPPGDAAGLEGPPTVRLRSAQDRARADRAPDDTLLMGRPSFGDALSWLLDLASRPTTCPKLNEVLFGVWISRGFPVAGIQLMNRSHRSRGVWTQRYEPAANHVLPAWLDPKRGGRSDPGLVHTVFLPAAKLIEIGKLTAPESERTPSMFNFHDALRKLHAPAGPGRRRPSWEAFLRQAEAAQQFADTIERQPGPLTELMDFGTNPGNLRMFAFVPDDLVAGAALVVALHGCTQNAASYDRGSGWSRLAKDRGFALLAPQQKQANNPLGCFNWFEDSDAGRGRGEALSIRQMIDRMIRDYGLDPNRVYITGLSAGGAMTSVMLAAYPDVFAGGAMVAGLPYRAARGVEEGLDVMFQGKRRRSREWGDFVRAASPHRGGWPKVSVWHGTADATVHPINSEEILKQWIDVHGVSSRPTEEKTLGGHLHRTWQGPDGETVIEAVTVRDMGHGQPVDPRGGEACGTSAPHFIDVGIAAARHIADFWGLTGDPSAHAPEEGQAPATHPEDAIGANRSASVESPNASGAAADRASVLTGTPMGPIDVAGIVTKSLELAGLATASSPAGAGQPGGVDIQRILDTSREVAGLAAGRSEFGRRTQDDSTAGQRGEGWREVADVSDRTPSGRVLMGEVISGTGGEMGRKRGTISCRLTLGKAPRLAYIRRLHLAASANWYTKAEFNVLVDGLPVDTVSAQGMDYQEAEWTERGDIDLLPCAHREVELSFEITAHSNVHREVSAKAWLRDVRLIDGAETRSISAALT